ncbi:MAG: BPSS1780 family membrane protein [Tepidimonas sp.]|uniref:BPSS1780 family membrane protein n=1 Tax=Tepidimonas sp. TaxID=2002775 RepID=UPI00259FD430|nr:BPSS1780 family membrane protein [Tepidimonas sp.]MDM7456868.1 BPSS1780 family membrane protein [Tepidimonas sp.]
MKLHRVPARTGLLWVRLGLRTFIRQPLAMAGLFFMFIMGVSVLAMVPLLGAPLALALLPAATLGLMAATKEADSGRFPMPAVLASAFRASRERVRAMLLLGGLYALGSAAVMALSAWLSGAPIVTTLDGTETTLNEPAVLRNLAWQAVLYIPLGLMFWHAPALVHWHGIHPVKALFFSLVACWTNKGALLLFMLGWSAVFLGVSLILVLLASALGGTTAMQVLVFPVASLLSAAFFTSLYFTFRDSFLTDEGEPPA